MTPPEVLFIEDNVGDATLMQAAFGRCWPGVRMHRVGTAQLAHSFMAREGRYADAPVPNLVLLDLNLPGDSGMTVLKRLTQDGGHMHAPIVVFSSSCRAEEIEECYRQGATLYVVKPSHWDGYVDLASSSAILAALSG